jgi:hypothetical protein
VKKGFLTRPQLFLLALVALAIGVGWNIIEDAKKAALTEGSVATSGAVVSVSHDALGCHSPWLFAARDCRTTTKIRHRPEGSTADEAYLSIDRRYFLPGPALQKGDAIVGSCESQVGLRGRCHFDQLEETPQQVKVFGIMGLLFLAVFALVLLRRKAGRASSSSP